MKKQRGYGPNKRPGFRPRLESKDAPFKLRSSYYSGVHREPSSKENNRLEERRKPRREKHSTEYRRHSCPDDDEKYDSVASRSMDKPRSDPEESRPYASSSKRNKEAVDRSSKKTVNYSYDKMKRERDYVPTQIDNRVPSRMNGNNRENKLELDLTKFKLSSDKPQSNPNAMVKDFIFTTKRKLNNLYANYISGDENSPKDRKSSIEGRASRHSLNIDFKISANCLNKSYTNIKKSYTILKNTCSSLSRKPSIRLKTGSSRYGSSCGDRSNLNVSFAGDSSIEEIETAADDDNIEERCVCCPFIKRPSFLNNIQRLLRVDSSMLGTLPDDLLDCAETRRNTELNKINSKTHESLRATSSGSQDCIRRNLDKHDNSVFRVSKVSLNNAEGSIRKRSKRNLKRSKFSLATDSRVHIHKYRARRRHRENRNDSDNESELCDRSFLAGSVSSQRCDGSICRSRSCFCRRSSISSRILASECSSTDYDDENSNIGITEGKRKIFRSKKRKVTRIQIHDEHGGQSTKILSKSRNNSTDNNNALTGHLENAIQCKKNKVKLNNSANGSKVRFDKERNVLNAERDVHLMNEDDNVRSNREERLKNYINSISGGTESETHEEKLLKIPSSTVLGKTRSCRSRISFRIGLESGRKSESCTCSAKNLVRNTSKTAVSSAYERDPNEKDFGQSDQDTRSKHSTQVFSCCLNYLIMKICKMSTRDR